MSCKKQIFTVLKPSTAPGVVPEVLSQFELVDGVAVPVEAAELTNCPETTYQTNDVCYVINGADPVECLSGKCTIAIEFDCAAEAGQETTINVIGITAADGTTILVGAEEGQASIVPCPEITVVSSEACAVEGEK